MKTRNQIAVIGGGPAGLRAAEVAAAGGAEVTLYEAKRSVGRKFLVAGKSGLNLTNAEPGEVFLRRYSGAALPVADWARWFDAFDNKALRTWAAGLGVDCFESAGGKVFPSSMRAAPLLRRWVERLRGLGVRFRVNHRWLGWVAADPLRLRFETGGEVVEAVPDAAVLALGGGSWPTTGSDGRWVEVLATAGVDVVPLAASNCGWEVEWPAAVIERAEGLPMKNLAVESGGRRELGELLLTRYGLEGTPIYRLGPTLRGQGCPELRIDFKPGLSQAQLVERMGKVRRNFVREAGRRWSLGAAERALLTHLPERGPWRDAAGLAREVKACRVPLRRSRPLVEAISSAGGVGWAEIDGSLMLRQRPGVFVAGEMVDWDAPTGGYLMQGCFLTGTRAAEGALGWGNGLLDRSELAQ